MKNINLISRTWFFGLKDVVGVDVDVKKEKWYKFKKNKYGIELLVMYNEHDFSESKYYTYWYDKKSKRDLVLQRFLDMDFNDFKKVIPPTIEFNFEP